MAAEVSDRLARSAAEFAARRRETAADVRLYVEIGLAPVRCRKCGVEAMVKKNSVKHTSIQWSAAATASCPILSATGPGTPHRLVLGCPQMCASIDDAVAAGELVVPDA